MVHLKRYWSCSVAKLIKQIYDRNLQLQCCHIGKYLVSTTLECFVTIVNNFIRLTIKSYQCCYNDMFSKHHNYEFLGPICLPNLFKTSHFQNFIINSSRVQSESGLPKQGVSPHHAQVFRIRNRIRIQGVFWIRIRIRNPDPGA